MDNNSLENNNNSFSNFLKKLNFELNCSCCSQRNKKVESRASNLKLENINNNENSTLINSDNLLFKNQLQNLNNFELEFINVGVLIKNKGRKKWSDIHSKTLKNCIKLFNNDISKIKIFLPEFKEEYILKKINKLNNDDNEKQRTKNNHPDDKNNENKKTTLNRINSFNNLENDYNKMIESMNELDVSPCPNMKTNNDNYLEEFNLANYLELDLNNKDNIDMIEDENNEDYFNDYKFKKKESLNTPDNLLDKNSDNYIGFCDYDLEKDINRIFEDNITLEKKITINEIIELSNNSDDSFN